MDGIENFGQRFPSPYRWVVPLLAVLFLLPTLFFPISPDHAIFSFGGKVILDGGVLYRDFVDIKPPLIYDIFAFIRFIFGSSEVSLRVFDLLWQLLALFSIHFVLTRWLHDERVASMSMIVYALSYTSSNYTSTLQCETLAALPLVWLLYLYGCREKYSRSWLIAGVLYAGIVHLKYTLGIVVVPLLLTDIFIRKPALRTALLRYSIFLAGFLVASTAIYLPLVLNGGWTEYLGVLDFVQRYAALQPVTGEWFGFAATSLLNYFGNKYSLLFSIAAGIGMVGVYRRKASLLTHEREFFGLFTLEVALLLLSVIVERKFIPYHFSRLYIVLSPFVAIGLLTLWKYGTEWWKRSTGFKHLLIIAITLPCLLATPLPRFIRPIWGSVLYLTNKEKYDRLYTHDAPSESVTIRADQVQAAQYVLAHKQPGDRVLVVAVHAAPVYYFVDAATAPALPSTQFYIADWCAPAWKQHFANDLRTANWLIIQTNDQHPAITGVNLTSEQFLREHSEYQSVLTSRYREVKRFGKFVVYGVE
jgi:hypothetical protein